MPDSLPSPEQLRAAAPLQSSRCARQIVIDMARRYVAEWGDGAEVIDKLIDRADRLPEDQRRELMRLGVMAAIEACGRAEHGAHQAHVERPHAPAVRAAKDKASWTPPASAGSGVAARLAVVAPGYRWELPNGAHLLEANVADIDGAIEAHRAKAAGHIAHVKVLAVIKDRMLKTRASRVGDIFTVQQIEELRNQHGVTADA
jgi:hypothetical protein